MFQFPRFPPPKGYPAITPGGLPHSEISGSPAASASPEHFVAWPRPSSASSAKASTVCPSFRSSIVCALSHPTTQLASFPAGTTTRAGLFLTPRLRRKRPTHSHRFAAGLPETVPCSHPQQVVPLGRLSSIHFVRCGSRWSRGGSNPEPPPCKGGALPVELRPRPHRAGGRAWTRTRDLGLIRAAL
jgi:hypothetical protein